VAERELPMLTERDVAILRDLYDDWNEGGVWTIAERYWAKDIEWQDPPEFPGSHVYRGCDSVAKHLDEWVKSLHNFRFAITVDEFVEAGDEIVAFLWVEGTTDEGLPVPRVRFVHVVRMEDGKVTRVRAFLHASEALEAAGLREHL
jgi:ketosteroid isomerase-like protein